MPTPSTASNNGIDRSARSEFRKVPQVSFARPVIPPVIPHTATRVGDIVGGGKNQSNGLRFGEGLHERGAETYAKRGAIDSCVIRSDCIGTRSRPRKGRTIS